jgi:hypothetical protein
MYRPLQRLFASVQDGDENAWVRDYLPSFQSHGIVTIADFLTCSPPYLIANCNISVHEIEDIKEYISLETLTPDPDAWSLLAYLQSQYQPRTEEEEGEEKKSNANSCMEVDSAFVVNSETVSKIRDSGITCHRMKSGVDILDLFFSSFHSCSNSSSTSTSHGNLSPSSPSHGSAFFHAPIVQLSGAASSGKTWLAIKCMVHCALQRQIYHSTYNHSSGSARSNFTTSATTEEDLSDVKICSVYFHAGKVAFPLHVLQEEVRRAVAHHNKHVSHFGNLERNNREGSDYRVGIVREQAVLASLVVKDINIASDLITELDGLIELAAESDISLIVVDELSTLCEKSNFRSIEHANSFVSEMVTKGEECCRTCVAAKRDAEEDRYSQSSGSGSQSGYREADDAMGCHILLLQTLVPIMEASQKGSLPSTVEQSSNRAPLAGTIASHYMRIREPLGDLNGHAVGVQYMLSVIKDADNTVDSNADTSSDNCGANRCHQLCIVKSSSLPQSVCTF